MSANEPRWTEDFGGVRLCVHSRKYIANELEPSLRPAAPGMPGSMFPPAPGMPGSPTFGQTSTAIGAFLLVFPGALAWIIFGVFNVIGAH